MSNFYGGKEGRSFVITKEFQSIAEMTEAFKQGPLYTEVNFDEYVLINTVNKNSPENGQLFRRGYDYNSDRKIVNYHLGVEDLDDETQKTYYTREMPAGGAIYVGTIVGPAGKAPKLNFGLYSTVEDFRKVYLMSRDTVSNTHNKDIPTMIAYLNKNYSNGISADDITYYFVHWVVTLDGVSSNYYFALDKDLYNSNPHQSIGWYQIDSLPKHGADSFKPHTADMPEGGKVVEGYVTDQDGLQHQKHEFHDTIDWIYCTMRNENGEDSTAYLGMRIPQPSLEIISKSVSPYENRSYDKVTGVYTNLNLITPFEDTYNKDGVASKTSDHPFYHKWLLNVPKGLKGESINNFRIVDKNQMNLWYFDLQDNHIQYELDGTAKMTLRSPIFSPGVERPVQQVIVYDYYNYAVSEKPEVRTVYLGDYNQIEHDGFTIDDNGTVVIDYTFDNTDTYEHLIKWINNIEFGNDGSVTVTMNNTSIFENGVLSKPQLINWLNSLTLNPDTGAFKATFNNANIPAIDTTLQWVKDIAIDDKGTITFDYTNTEKVLSQRLNWIEAMTFNTDTGALSVTFNNSNISNISHTLNYIQSFERDANDHLIITHSDPAKGRQDLGSISYMVAAPAENEAVRNLATDGIWIITKEYNPQNNG